MSDAKSGSVESRYNQLTGKRETYLIRAREAAAYTIPALFPPLGHNEATSLPQPYNSVGAEGINNLASKLLLSQMAPNTPFFRLIVDQKVEDDLAQGDPQFRTELDATFSKLEQSVQRNIDKSGDRTAASEAFKQLLVAGNVLLFIPTKGTMRVIRLDNYVLKRDPEGEVMEIITRESVAITALPDDLQSALGQMTDCNDTHVDVFTHIQRTKTNWTTKQEIKGIIVKKSLGTYPLEESPYIPLRFTRVDGEDYGRGFVEEYIGDIMTLDGLSQAIKEGAIASARIIPLVNPAGNLRPKDLEKPNGTPVLGEASDLTFAQVGKQADLSVAMNYADGVEKRLQRAFLMFSGAQRNADRVTAEEIRAIINELEERLGGFYSILAQEFQLPYVKRKMFQMKRAGLLPELPKDLVEPTIITGLQALGRGQELSKLKEYLQIMSTIMGPQAIQQMAVVQEISKRVASALAFDDTGIMKSQEQVAQEQQAAQANEMAQKVGPNLVNQLGNAMQGATPNG